MERGHSQTESILALRANFLELLAVAIGIALGVNLMAGGALLLLGWSGLAVGGLGAAFTISAGVYLVYRIAPRINQHFSFEGLLPVIADGHEVINIDRYEYAEDSANHIRALMAENKALAKAWTENPLSEFDKVDNVTSPAIKLAREAMEYFVLRQLSLHLSSYFQDKTRDSDAEITTIGRQDIPTVLLE